MSSSFEIQQENLVVTTADNGIKIRAAAGLEFTIDMKDQKKSRPFYNRKT